MNTSNPKRSEKMNFKTYLESVEDDAYKLTEQDLADIHDLQQKMARLGLELEKLDARPPRNLKHVTFELSLEEELSAWLILQDDILSINDKIELITPLVTRLVEDVMAGTFNSVKVQRKSDLTNSGASWVKVQAFFATPAIAIKWRGILRKLAQKRAGYSKIDYKTKI